MGRKRFQKRPELSRCSRRAYFESSSPSKVSAIPAVVFQTGSSFRSGNNLRQCSLRTVRALVSRPVKEQAWINVNMMDRHYFTHKWQVFKKRRKRGKVVMFPLRSILQCVIKGGD